MWGSLNLVCILCTAPDLHLIFAFTNIYVAFSNSASQDQTGEWCFASPTSAIRRVAELNGCGTINLLSMPEDERNLAASTKELPLSLPKWLGFWLDSVRIGDSNHPFFGGLTIQLQSSIKSSWSLVHI